jgi:hypothetical protein
MGFGVCSILISVNSVRGGEELAEGTSASSMGSMERLCQCTSVPRLSSARWHSGGGPDTLHSVHEQMGSAADCLHTRSTNDIHFSLSFCGHNMMQVSTQSFMLRNPKTLWLASTNLFLKL